MAACLATAPSSLRVVREILDLQRGERLPAFRALVAASAVTFAFRVDARERVLERETAAQLQDIGFGECRERRDHLERVAHGALRQRRETVEELGGGFGKRVFLQRAERDGLQVVPRACEARYQQLEACDAMRVQGS